MREPELVARAGYAAARLEQAWERWRALHGLGGSADPLASYVGYSLKEPMGQPRVVIGVDAAEAEFFADFLESQAGPAPGTDSGQAAEASPAPGASLAVGDNRPRSGNGTYPSLNGNGAHPPLSGTAHPVNGTAHQVNGLTHPPASGPLLPPFSGPQRALANGAGPARPSFTPATPASPAASGPVSPGPGPAESLVTRGAGPAAPPTGGPGAAPVPREMLSEPMVRLADAPGPGAGPAPLSGQAGPLAAPVGGDYGPGPSAPSAPVTGVFPAPPAELPHYPGLGEPMAAEPPDAIAAEMAGWSSGELPGQASEQLASWAAGESGPHRFRRSRSAR